MSWYYHTAALQEEKFVRRSARRNFRIIMIPTVPVICQRCVYHNTCRANTRDRKVKYTSKIVENHGTRLISLYITVLLPEWQLN